MRVFWKNQSGMTLVEVMVSAAILALLAESSMLAMQNLGQRAHLVVESASSQKLLSSLFENFRNNMDKLQVDYKDPAPLKPDQAGQILSQAKFPLAWSEDFFGPLSSCTTCPGRAAYIIQPSSLYPGLYQATLRVSHPQLYGSGFKDFTFTVMGK
jgi:prepilin-type N-terminal cleavage/methylation domain-containing protein